MKILKILFFPLSLASAAAGVDFGASKTPEAATQLTAPTRVNHTTHNHITVNPAPRAPIAVPQITVPAHQTILFPNEHTLFQMVKLCAGDYCKFAEVSQLHKQLAGKRMTPENAARIITQSVDTHRITLWDLGPYNGILPKPCFIEWSMKHVLMQNIFKDFPSAINELEAKGIMAKRGLSVKVRPFPL